MISKTRESGQAKLTPLGSFFLLLVGIAVLGYVGYAYKDKLPFGKSGNATKSTGEAGGGTGTPAASSGAGGAAGNVLARVRQAGVIRIGMEPDAPPLHYINDQQKEDGFDFVLAAMIAKRLGVAGVEVVEADYEKLPEMLLAGQCDVIMGGYVPDDSIQGVAWSNGYLDFGLCMIVAENMGGTLKEPRDLARKTVAIYDDPAAERWVRDNIANVNVKKFSGDDGWFESVEKGQADALIYDYPFASVEIQKHPRTIIAKYNLNQSKYAVGVPTGNFDLVYEINKAIDEIKSSDDYSKMMRKYLASKSDVFTKPIEGAKTYTVKEGETLSKIAEQKLGSVSRWKDIWELNKNRVADPNLIYPQLVLLMP